MNDPLEPIDRLTVDNYKTAFSVLRDGMTASDLLMLRIHYQANKYDVTATELAGLAGFRNHEAANLRYGRLASKFLRFFQIQLPANYVKIHALVNLENRKSGWHWILMPQVVQALHELNWFDEKRKPTILEDIQQFKESYKDLPKTTREAVIQSRIGQGKFRDAIVQYWQACSVTGCEQIGILRASHIKPWRNSSNAERLNIYNGLLLLPNLDTCFDLGLISFDDDGKILISSQLDRTTLTQLGINPKMKLARIEQQHKVYLR